jgi:membrane associated rhomboid family serine protease
MPRGGMTLSMPPFTPAVTWLLAINLSIFLLLRLFHLSDPTRYIVDFVFKFFALHADTFIHGYVWQLVTYAFIHFDPLNIILVLLGIWFLGAILESAWGTQRFLIFYLASAFAGGVGSLALVYAFAYTYSKTTTLVFQLPFMGANGAILGMLVAIGVLWANMDFTAFPFPFTIKAKYLVWIAVVVDLVYALRERGGILSLGEFGGVIFALVYVKLTGPSSSRKRSSPGVYIGRGLSDRAFDQAPAKKPSFFARWRDSYYRWKRRRAARKFEVYMRKHDRKVYFDEHGNYIDPESAEGQRRGEDDSKKPWIN